MQKLGGHPQFYEVRRDNEKLYSAKHYQYATDADPMSNFRLCGQLIRKLLKPSVDPTIAAALTLMSKQIVGVYEIVGEGKDNTLESLEDKLRDIEIYSSIIQVLLKDTAGLGKAGHGVAGQGEGIKSGPYCEDCDKPAYWRSDTGLYWCEECPDGLDTSNWTRMETL